MREIKIEVLWIRHKKDFTTEILKHYTTIDRLCNGLDKFDYKMVDVIAKRQYTGLKDANGVEIYEGDIVGPCSNGWNWVIEWGSFGDTGFYGSNQINSCRRLEPTPYSNDGAIIEITEDDILQCVVIGNIHENPELLL